MLCSAPPPPRPLAKATHPLRPLGSESRWLNASRLTPPRRGHDDRVQRNGRLGVRQAMSDLILLSPIAALLL